jgi:hypothetical protein
VNDTGNVTEDGEEDVDQEIRAATALEEDTERWEDDGKDDLADVAENGPVLVNRQALILASAVLETQSSRSLSKDGIAARILRKWRK